MADEDPVSAHASANDPAEGVLAPDVVDPPPQAPSDRGGGDGARMDVIGPPGGPGEKFEVLTDLDGSTVIRVTGELDVTTVPALEAVVGRMLNARGARLAVDASDLEFVDSSAIALLVRWADRLGQVEIRDASPLVRRTISRMGLAERLRLTP